MSAYTPRIPKDLATIHDAARGQGQGGTTVQCLANSSHPVSRLSAIQDTATQSPRVQRLVQMKARLQHGGTAQRKPVEANRTGMSDELKTGIESLSGVSLDDVRVHYNSTRPAQLQALAYTQGADIHVGPGQEQHLPHEAWHVVQQKQGRVTPTRDFNGAPVNDSPALESEAQVMGDRATLQPMMAGSLHEPPVQRMTGTQGAAPIQLMRVVRWMDAGKESDYISKLGAQDPEAYARLHRELVGGGRGGILQAIDRHGQGMLGDETPFVSVAVNPYSLSWGTDDSESGVGDILQGARHDVWFDVPDEYLYPGSTELSQSETELLVLLPPGVSLERYIATRATQRGQEPLIKGNPWRGMTTEERRTELRRLNPEFTRLAVRGSREGEPGSFVMRQEVVPAPWEAQAGGNGALDFGGLPRGIQERVIDLAAENWAGGAAAFRQGLAGGQAWARAHLESTLRDNEAGIRRAMS
ncbi:DUF4157 domain-containing protein [Myxococcus sp. CA033]|uniref:eCIS core domain-containing protein n=2 Tax=unclassified Myxococcus TaxID=2648731 RepID=UPI00157B7B3D|nr:DUF4157 domain-containing protein [Myxococcus sp. CA033]NTX40554.1 DUF4157 domain-containing protein [Myxococcus sp. CA033]NTX50884.1 DUF4157 domain-containing protein [Myxococcus sp. CA039A]